MQGAGSINFGKIGTILLLAVSVCSLLSALFSFIQGWIMTGVTQRLCYRLRRDISEKIHRMPMKYFESKTVGEVLSRITNDIDTLGQSLNQSVTQLITSVTTIIGVIIMMLSINTIMTGVTIVILPVSMLVMTVVKHSQKYFRAQQAFLGTINGQVEETYSGHNAVRAFNREQAVLDEFRKTKQKAVPVGVEVAVFLRPHAANYAVYRQLGLCRRGCARRHSGRCRYHSGR